MLGGTIGKGNGNHVPGFHTSNPLGGYTDAGDGGCIGWEKVGGGGGGLPGTFTKISLLVPQKSTAAYDSKPRKPETV